MNEISPIETAMAVQRAVFGLVPATMAEAMKLAEMMASAKLVPAALQKSPADCLMVIQQAVRWQMDPFAVAQECSVIQGKLMHSGKLVAAVVNARGNLTQRLSFDYHGEGESRSITVSGQLQGEAEPRTVIVWLRDAKTGNRVWTTQPDQQLMYHGCRVWARRHTPELMLGVWSPEEFDEPDKPMSRRPAPPAANVMLPLIDSDTGEILDDEATPHTPSAAAEDPASPGSVRGRVDAGTDSDTVDSETIAMWDAALGLAAQSGKEALKDKWGEVPPEIKPVLKAALDRRHKPAALKVV